MQPRRSSTQRRAKRRSCRLASACAQLGGLARIIYLVRLHCSHRRVEPQVFHHLAVTDHLESPHIGAFWAYAERPVRPCAVLASRFFIFAKLSFTKPLALFACCYRRRARNEESVAQLR